MKLWRKSRLSECHANLFANGRTEVAVVTMFAVANGYVRLLNSLSGAASPLPLGNPSVCFS